MGRDPRGRTHDAPVPRPGGGRRRAEEGGGRNSLPGKNDSGLSKLPYEMRGWGAGGGGGRPLPQEHGPALKRHTARQVGAWLSFRPRKGRHGTVPGETPHP